MLTDLEIRRTMRALIQRVLNAKVEIEGETVGQIEKGFLVFLGVKSDDEIEDLQYITKKVSNLRVFNDEEGRMNISPEDFDAEILAVSQFTLYASTKKGNRPSFTDAAKGEKAENYYNKFVEMMREKFKKVETGRFGADMQVSLVNDGPVTIMIDSEDKK